MTLIHLNPILNQNQIVKKCSICHNAKAQLIKLPDEPFQQYAAEKGFISYYCCSCCQVVNFLLS